VWDNCGLCQLCKQTQESADHLFFPYQFTKRLWNLVIDWLGIANIRNQDWVHGTAIEEWWTMMVCYAKPNRKAIASITMLVSWTIWNERNARVFNNKAAPMTVLLEIIKSEVRLWIAAGAKNLSIVMLRE
jgi:hypothetical protein